MKEAKEKEKNAICSQKHARTDENHTHWQCRENEKCVQAKGASIVKARNKVASGVRMEKRQAIFIEQTKQADQGKQAKKQGKCENA